MLLTVSELQNSIGKNFYMRPETHAKALGLTTIVMTSSAREELIAWYKRHGYFDTTARPFPVGDIHVSISEQPLEFMVQRK
jgi:hypothetical protein